MTSVRPLNRLICSALFGLAALGGCADYPEPTPLEDVVETEASEEAVDQSRILRESAPSGEWDLVKLTGDRFGKDYGYWYLEDEDFKAGQSLLSVSSVDVTFVVDECTDEICSGHIEPGADAAKSEPEGHLYPWAGEGQKHTFTWDGEEIVLSTKAEETEGICYDTETGEDLPGTSWTDTASYKYSDVDRTAGSGDGVADSINAKYRVDYETVFIPHCEGPTTMFLEGSITFQRDPASN